MEEPLRYPLTTFTDKTDYLKIAIIDYISIKNSNNKSLVGSPQSRKNRGKNLKEVILLPMPSNISDNNAVKYGDSSLNSIIGAAGAGIIDIMESAKESGKLLRNLGENVKETGSNVADTTGGIGGIQGYLTRQLASRAIGIIGGNITPSQLLARTTGEILNPNLELLFNGPTLRTFRFQFKMVPRSDLEGKQIKKIIRAFKEYMAPKVSSGEGSTTENTTFLRTPSVFELTYKQGSEDHLYLHRFKQCFLESISVNYTGAGVYSTYDDGTPVAMIMDLYFKEIEPVYDVDQNEEGGTGY
jgi:hypothetical protein